MNYLSKGLKVAVVCAAGAGIGTLIALQLGWFWPLGILIGAAFSYLVIDWSGVVTVIKTHWPELRDGLGNLFDKIVVWFSDPEGFKEYFHDLRSSFVFFVLSLFSMATGLIIMWLGWIICPNVDELSFIEAIVSGSCVLLLGAGFLMSMIYLVMSMLGLTYCVIGCNIYDDKDFPNFANTFKYTNCFSFFLYTVPLGLLWLPFKGLPLLISFLKKTWPKVKVFGLAVKDFVKAVFITIHSQLRVLCFIDTALGALAGYFFHNLIIGMAVGFVFSFVNYYVVAIKWLKLMPAISRS